MASSVNQQNMLLLSGDILLLAVNKSLDVYYHTKKEKGNHSLDLHSAVSRWCTVCYYGLFGCKINARSTMKSVKQTSNQTAVALNVEL